MGDTVNTGDPSGFDAFKAASLLGVVFTYLNVLYWCLACESILGVIYIIENRLSSFYFQY